MPPTYAEYLEAQAQLEQQGISFAQLVECQQLFTKTLSAYNSSRGGALVPPPYQGSPLKIRRYRPALFDQHRIKQLRLKYRTKGWITVGGGPCEGGEGQHCGGTRVFADSSGNVLKGPKKITGTRLSKKPKTPQIEPTEKIPSKPSPPQIPKPVKPEPSTQKVPPGPPKLEWKVPEEKPSSLKKVELPTTWNVPVTVQETREKLLKKITDQEEEALVYYTGAGFAELNKSMRLCPEDLNCLDDKQKVLLARIESGLAKIEPFSEPVTVYRGISVSEDIYNQLLEQFSSIQQQKKIYVMPSVSSTTLEPLVTQAFGSKIGGRKSIVFQIQARKGFYPGGLSEYPDEQEIIQSSATRYRVTELGITEEDSTVIYLEEIP